MANITVAGHHLYSNKISVVEEPGQWIYAKRLAVLHTLSLFLHVFAHAGGDWRTILQTRIDNQ